MSRLDDQVDKGGESKSEGPVESLQVVNPEAGNLIDSVSSEVDDALNPKKRIDLGINWDSLDREALFASLRKYDDAENIYPKLPGERHDTFLLHSAEILTQSGEKIRLEFYKSISTYNGITKDELIIRMRRPDVDPNDIDRHDVAGFDFLRNKHDQSEEWDMKHRETLEAYRKQGIADQINGIAEEAFKRRFADNNLRQSISAKSGQKDLTFWLEKEKRGFGPATSEDAENLARLESINNGLQEVSMNGQTYTFDTEEFRTKFGGIVSGPDDPAVWDEKNSGETFFYTRSCFKIKLEKKL